jgi:hypothetical protein
MTTALHLPARAGAPIACDMSAAPDTPEQRLAEYRELFARALVRRERRARAVAFTLRDRPGVREQIEDLARREAACCPFLGYRVETVAGEVVFIVADPAEDAQAESVLDAFYALPDPAATMPSAR